MDLFSSLENQQSVGQFSEQAYLNYSMYVILDRALPHISDGLKTCATTHNICDE